MMWGSSFNWLMMFVSTLWIVLLAVLVWAVMRWLKQRMTSPPRQTYLLPESGSTAREILSQRYARGEIDAPTFEQMRERLEVSDNLYQGSRAEGQRPTGERLFDGRTSGSEIS